MFTEPEDVGHHGVTPVNWSHPAVLRSENADIRRIGNVCRMVVLRSSRLTDWMRRYAILIKRGRIRKEIRFARKEAN